jgi:hypothetical protein
MRLAWMSQDLFVRQVGEIFRADHRMRSPMTTESLISALEPHSLRELRSVVGAAMSSAVDDSRRFKMV